MVKITYIYISFILYLVLPVINYAQCRDTIILNKKKYIAAHVIAVKGKELRYITFDKNGNQEIETIDTSRIYEVKYCTNNSVVIYNQDKILFVEDPDVKYYKPLKQPIIKSNENSYHLVSFNPLSFISSSISLAYERQVKERFAFRISLVKGFYKFTGSQIDQSGTQNYSYTYCKQYGTTLSISYLPKTIKKIKSLVGLSFDFGQLMYYDTYGNINYYNANFLDKHLAIHIASMAHFGYIFPIKCFFISPRAYGGIQKNFTIQNQQNITGCFRFEINMGVKF